MTQMREALAVWFSVGADQAAHLSDSFRRWRTQSSR